MDRMEFGKRFRHLRKDHLNKSMAELSEILGISTSFISDLENGKSLPGAEIIYSLYRKFSINSQWLVTGEGSIFVKTPTGEGETEAALRAAVGWHDQGKVPAGTGTLHALGTTLVREPEDVHGRDKPAQQTVKLEKLDPRKSNVTEVRGVVDHLKSEREIEQLRQENAELKARLDQMEKMFALFVKTGQTTKQPTPETKETVPV